MKRIAFLASFLALTGIGATCGGTDSGFTIPDKALKPGGVYVAYNLGCEAGCDQIEKGDLIQKMDGATVETAEDLKTLTDGKPHKLEVLAKATDWKAPKTVEVTATPKNNLPPLKDTPPFWLASAEAMLKTPSWARRRMFGHASPMIMLVSSDGGILDGRQLFGQKRFIVYWDWGDRVEEATAIDFMQVLQKAQGDLKSRNIEVMFVHMRFPTGRKAPMNDTDLRAWYKKWTVKEGGRSLDELPSYRFPNETEFNSARELGMENAYTVRENLGSSPAILLLDERGIVRWHSEGVVDPQMAMPEIKDPEQSTIIRAVEFAKNDL